ncbi:DUF1640 domain-containing protein [Escherichia coli]|uniref:hypothetical protein n=1 Tax=Escherichia coli TaxID=562 RepID=UPI00067FBF27|nr:hypothetical protein [Escherichia coli]EFB4150344.1 DUF1640 domain-containing protein [Escherichia coli O128]EKF4275278.1 DUF1640 domain-containing protein [Escherichia coli O45]EKH5288532.1 DUF1640 domain-containing protein [Escherichia coli O76]EKY6186083.1 DUF1640 domain-containing protein [Escherichia coli O8]EEQ1518294.1 DUF1640 domain-containing protein [Escherichia coli]
MAQVYFDTLKFVETLEAAGMPAAQARAISAAVKDSHEAAEVATKRDLNDVKTELKNDIAAIDAKIDKLTLQLTVRFGGMLVVAVGALAAIIKLPL